jgi:hypothetical protein
MKKLLVLLLISIMAIFVFAGCDGIGTPAEGEGEGEGEGEDEEITVEIEDAVELGGKNWVSAGNHDITVTFPAPVEGSVAAIITDCTGDYSKDKDSNIVLFPNEDKTEWTGSGKFEGKDIDDVCCASYVGVYAGECEADVCVEFPVIVDAEPPYAKIEIDLDDDNDDTCACGGCALTFNSETIEGDCAETECCGDDCSGLAGWSIALFDEKPFDECCDTPCEEPIFTCSGTDCPVDCITDCLNEDEEDVEYYVVANLVDNVGNEVEYYAEVGLDSACNIDVTEFCANISEATGGDGCDCTDWTVEAELDTDEYIGFCSAEDNCCF